MVIKPNKDLIYELCIPLSQLFVDIDWKKPLVYNIKSNSPAKSNFKKEGDRTQRPKLGGKGGMGGRRRAGMGGDGKTGGPNGTQRLHEGGSENKAANFWIKYNLVKA